MDSATSHLWREEAINKEDGKTGELIENIWGTMAEEGALAQQVRA